MTRITGTLHEDLRAFMIISRSVLLKKGNISDKFVETIKTRVLYSIPSFRKSCRLWDNVEKLCRARQATDDNITRRKRFACWIPKAIDTPSEYVILTAFPRQQWFRGHASMLRLCVHCLSCLVQSVQIDPGAKPAHFLSKSTARFFPGNKAWCVNQKLNLSLVSRIKGVELQLHQLPTCLHDVLFKKSGNFTFTLFWTLGVRFYQRTSNFYSRDVTVKNRHVVKS
jgi:hypothetical protein